MDLTLAGGGSIDGQTEALRRLRRCALATLLAIAVPLPAGAGAATVDARDLRATIQANPWRIAFVAPSGRTVLAEHPGRGTGPTGTLGFEATGAWRHATRVLSARREGAAYVATLATDDPLGRRIAVRVAPDRRGVIALRARVLGPRAGVEALGIGFRARRGERYLGFGERSNAVDQRGRVVENYVAEGPYQEEEEPFITPFVPPWGYQRRDDSTYFPIPWLLSTHGYGVLVDNTETSYFRLGSERADGWSLEARAAPPNQPQGAPAPAPERLSLRVFAGPKPADALRRFTAATGRQPKPAAPWYFGPWFQPSGDERAQVRRLRRADAPVSVAQTYTHYLPCGEHEGARGAERHRTKGMHAAGLAVTTYFNPMVCTDYEEAYGPAARQGALTKTVTGQPYRYRYSTSDQFLVAQYDFSAAAGRRLYGDRLAEAVADGYDGWMEDFGEYTPLDSRSANGMDGTEMHNLYPRQYHCAAHAFARRQERPLGRFVRSGFTGSARCSQIVWGGDPTTDWGFDGLASAVTNGLTMGLSGVSTWGSDIGGFFALGQRRLTPELLKRWVQLGAVSGVMRTQAEGIAIPPKPRPQVYDDGQIDHWRRYAKLRTQLYPYLVAADAHYRRTGTPIMRHLALVHPRDHRAVRQDREFLFGPDLLAAPVLEPGARERRMYLPKGRWVDLWRSVDYVRASGGLQLERPRVLAGRGRATLPAPLYQLPLLARAGTLLALLPPDVETLAPYGRGVVNLHDRRGRMRLLAFPRGYSSASFLAGERLRSREGRARWRLRVDGERRRSYRLQASLRTLRHPFRPCRVTVDGERLPARRWSYRPGTGTLTARFTTRDGVLRAIRRCGR